MPLARYQIRNEYSLADPELYRAADKDDPEALLEGVAMAGLVGVLRQLGDLAEFAAEVFHDLHEEVMATAARGHGLMARVQQLEAEVPSIEKAFLSQTDQSPFFTNAGVDWHPNLHSEQNLITSGDLPRFVMDSYEECRGPPRLFLLDKFDVAGAGACLKRYTDPSFFKVEAASFGIPAGDVQREKKIRKVKKKGSRWRNGETTPEGPTSHAKLHQLFLEERVESGHSDPARIVKLKRRQLNRSPFDLKPGKSFMEKFLGTPSPEHKVVCEVSVDPPPLKLTLDNYSESGLEIVEINIVSPAEKSSQVRESTHSSPVEEEAVLKPLTHELNKENLNREIVKVPDLVAGGEGGESPCIIQKMAVEEELAIDRDGKTEGSLDGDHSDDLMSEVDNYMDALTTMESEMETDNEYKPKNDQGFLKIRKHKINSDTNEEHLDVQANFSDTQSVGNSSTSDDGKGLFKKEKYGISYSDSLSNFTENTPSDNEGQVKIFPSENSLPEAVDSPSDTPSVHVETLGTQSGELIMFNNKCIEEDTILNAGEASCSSCVSDSNPLLPPPVPAANSVVVSFEEKESDVIPSEFIKLEPESPDIDQSGTDLPDSSIVISDVPSQTVHSNILKASSKSCRVEELDHEDPNVFMHSSNVSDLEKEEYNGSGKEVLQKDYEEGIRDEDLVEGKTDSPPSVISPLKEQFPCSVLPEIDVDSGVPLASDSSDVVKPVHIDSEVDHVVAATGVNSENLMGMVETPEVDSSKEDRHSDMAADVSQVQDDLTGVTYSEKNMTKPEEISEDAGGEDINGFASMVVVEGNNFVPLQHPANYSDDGQDEHENLEDVGASPVTSVVAFSSIDVVYDASRLSSDLYCFPSSNLLDIEESHSGSSHQEGLGHNEGVFPECYTEPVPQNEMKKLEPTYLDSSPHELVSEDHSNLEVHEHVHELALADQTQNCSHVSDVSTVSSSEPNNEELELKHAYLRHSADSSQDVLCLPTCYPQEVETSLEHSEELQADENFAESAHAVMCEENSAPLFLQSSPPCHLEEPAVPSKQALDLQCDHLDIGCLQEHEAGSKSTDLQSDIHTVSDIGQERCLDASSKPDAITNQELLMQSANQEPNSTMPSRNPFDSVFPSFDLLPQNLEEMPPLPPLPPMQWRIGKFQPAPLASQTEWVSHGEGSFLPMRPLKADEKSQSDFVSSSREIIQPANPFLSFTSADIQGSQHLSTESMENSLQPTPVSLESPTVVSNANNQNCPSLEGNQSLNPFLTLQEKTSERPEDGFHASGGRTVGSSPDPSSAVGPVGHTPTEHDYLSSHVLEINPSDQVTSKSILEEKAPEWHMQTSEGDERDSLNKSVATPTMLEYQPQFGSEALHGETTWLPSSLALPPTYEVGKTNGSKLPRPRNPLIDAVAAHDKSKLRKVTDRVRPQIGPKIDERDSLLEQIRTKSFNLKPTAVTRPSIQGIQGPKTNLKVAAILEKANAIRQALAGSDEDDDADSWSDS